MPTTADRLTLAMERQQTGDFLEAERIYRQVLAAEPENPDALHMLGVLFSQQGQQELASSMRWGGSRTPSCATKRRCGWTRSTPKRMPTWPTRWTGWAARPTP
jgi:hypothetical protein